MIECVIFDLDGTLLNTSEEIHKLINRALDKFSLPAITYEQTVSYIGNGAKKLVERAVPSDNSQLIDDVYRYFTRIYAECANDHTSLYEGEEEFLNKIKEKGIKTAILTNKPQAATDNVYKKFLQPFRFNLVLGQSERFQTKPSPEAALYIAERLNVRTDECLFVGDGETDVLTAKNAGMAAVAVLWGYRNKNCLMEAGATVFAENFDQLYKIICNCEK